MGRVYKLRRTALLFFPKKTGGRFFRDDVLPKQDSFQSRKPAILFQIFYPWVYHTQKAGSMEVAVINW